MNTRDQEIEYLSQQINNIQYQIDQLCGQNDRWTYDVTKGNGISNPAIEKQINDLLDQQELLCVKRRAL